MKNIAVGSVMLAQRIHTSLIFVGRVGGVLREVYSRPQNIKKKNSKFIVYKSPYSLSISTNLPTQVPFLTELTRLSFPRFPPLVYRITDETHIYPSNSENQNDQPQILLLLS